MKAQSPHLSATAWLMVARNVSRFLCGDKDGVTERCNHTSIRAACRCRKAPSLYARLKNGEIIRVSPHRIRASNGEGAILTNPTTQADYEAACRSDKTW